MKRKPRRNKKLKKVYFYRRLALVIGILLLLTLLFFGIRHLLTIESIEVHGASKLNDEDILVLSNIDYGKSYLSIDNKKTEQKIESLDYVKKASINYKLPKTLLIEVEEEAAVAQVFDRDLYALLNNELKIIEKTHSYHKELPRIVGVPVRHTETGEFLLDTSEKKEKLKFFKTLFDSPLLNDIQSIEIKEQGLSLQTRDDIKVIIRSFRKADYKLEQLANILKEIREKDENIATILLDQGEHPIAIKEGEDTFLDTKEISEDDLPPKNSNLDTDENNQEELNNNDAASEENVNNNY